MAASNMLSPVDYARANYHAALMRDYGKDVADEVIRMLKPLERPIDQQALASR
jgi:hypothetical protein